MIADKLAHRETDRQTRSLQYFAPLSGAELLTLTLSLYAFSALTLLVGCQQEHPACKN